MADKAGFPKVSSATLASVNTGADTHTRTQIQAGWGGCIYTPAFKYTSGEKKKKKSGSRPLLPESWVHNCGREREPKQGALPGWGAREVCEAREPGAAQALGSMLGSAGWTGLEPAMFTRSQAASGRPAGGRKGFAKRWRPRNMCGESESPGGTPPAKKGARNQRFPGLESQRREGRATPDSTCTPQTLRTPAKLLASSAAGPPSLPLPLCPHLSLFVFTPRTAPPLPGHSGKSDRPPQWGRFLDQAQKPSLGSLPPFLSHTYRCSSRSPY